MARKCHREDYFEVFFTKSVPPYWGLLIQNVSVGKLLPCTILFEVVAQLNEVQLQQDALVDTIYRWSRMEIIYSPATQDWLDFCPFHYFLLIELHCSHSEINIINLTSIFFVYINWRKMLKSQAKLFVHNKTFFQPLDQL